MFTFLIYALVAAFANLGKAVAVLLLIIQVTFGSFPLQLLPPFVQALSRWLPATHVVNAMRAYYVRHPTAPTSGRRSVAPLCPDPPALIGLVLRKPLATFMTWYVEQVESSKLVGWGLRLPCQGPHGTPRSGFVIIDAEKREGTRMARTEVNRRRVARSTTSGWSPESISGCSPRS